MWHTGPSSATPSSRAKTSLTMFRYIRGNPVVGFKLQILYANSAAASNCGRAIQTHDRSLEKHIANKLLTGDDIAELANRMGRVEQKIEKICNLVGWLTNNSWRGRCQATAMINVRLQKHLCDKHLVKNSNGLYLGLSEICLKIRIYHDKSGFLEIIKDLTSGVVSILATLDFRFRFRERRACFLCDLGGIQSSELEKRGDLISNLLHQASTFAQTEKS